MQDHFGIDWDGPLSMMETEGVEVPTVSPPISSALLEQLKSEVDPLRESNDCAVGIYIEAKTFVESVI